MQTITKEEKNILPLGYFFLMLFFLWALLSIIYQFAFYMPQESQRIKQKILNEQQATVLNNDQNNNTEKTDKINHNKKQQPVELSPTFSEGDPFSVELTDSINAPSFVHSEGFNFPRNDFVHTLPMSAELEDNIDTLKLYVINQKNNRLIITGKYLPDEVNRTMFPDLGIARANDIKNYLIQKGFEPNQLNVASAVAEKINHKQDNIVFSMIGLMVKKLSGSDVSKEKASIRTIKKQIKQAPLVLKFNMGKSEIEMTDKQRKKMMDIVQYVGKTPKAKVKVVGHTDSIGSKTKNYKLGLDRANFASKFMIDNGMPADAIHVYSEGEANPVASNNTFDGQLQNRRTVITVE